ncbi:DsbA family protein [Caulobacter segnis]
MALRPDVEAKLIWRPYQLDPSLPEEGVDRKAVHGQQVQGPRAAEGRPFGPGRGRRRGRHRVQFRGHRTVVPNTNAAHRLIRWALTAGLQDQVVEALFKAYFEQGPRHRRPDGAGRHRRSRRHGASGGAATALRRRRQGGRGPRARHGRPGRGVTGVPFAIFAGKVAVVGAETPERIVQAIDQALATPA